MSENFVTVVPGITGLWADNGCILWNGILNTDGYGYTIKDELIVDYSLALDEDLGWCLREGCSAGHHCDDIGIGLKSGQTRVARTSILPVQRMNIKFQQGRFTK